MLNGCLEMRPRPAFALFAALFFGLVAQPGVASTMRVVSDYQPSLADPSARESDLDAEEFVFEGSPGEANRVSIVREKDSARSRSVRIKVRDSGALLHAGAGCRQVDPHAASCRVATTCGRSCDVHLSMTVRLGDGDDRARLVRFPTPGALHVNPRIEGAAGVDRLVGGSGDDQLDGGTGGDSLFGEGGLDSLDGGDEGHDPAADLLDGGAGRRGVEGAGDGLSYERRTAPVTVDLAAGTGGQAGESDRIVGIEHVAGGLGADVLRGDGRANAIVDQPFTSEAGQRADTLDGRGGNDTLTSTDGLDLLLGGGGNDLLEASGGTVTARGSSGSDRLLGGYGNDVLDGGSGRDRLYGSRGTDQLFGGFGTDLLDGAGGNDTLLGGPGRDRLFGERPADGRGDDVLDGGTGQDRLAGGPGSDRFLTRDRQRDRLDGGRGRDSADFDRGLDRLRRIEIRR